VKAPGTSSTLPFENKDDRQSEVIVTALEASGGRSGDPDPLGAGESHPTPEFPDIELG
jgi:hypothetical protein